MTSRIHFKTLLKSCFILLKFINWDEIVSKVIKSSFLVQKWTLLHIYGHDLMKKTQFYAFLNKKELFRRKSNILDKKTHIWSIIVIFTQ